ncbi:MAG: cysteine hydrolase [Acidovorax sp.]|uniref:cysteine hydrolase family protein n=1 Tax=Acidovorax sp. TaxID=1872122 RepID=UPI0025C0A83E|nr:isochorismatase family cysteine hydrolase [Acidovorax sp.]MCE1191575.1 cysteine hydrolase [Acidovorax sp.]
MRSTHPWLLERARRRPLQPSPTVLVLVDFINPMDFPGAEKLLKSARAAAQATAQLKHRLARRGVVAIYANDNYGVWHSDFKELVAACQQLPGARGEIATLLAPGENDLTVLKPRHSAFHSTPLDHLLQQLKARELVIVGLAADMCVHLTAMDAYMHGYRVWVPGDCTAAESEASKATALGQMARVFKCSVRKSA